ncbi:MAG: NfeD family protein [Bacteroidetes bacterium]|nr:NfeD family protein [Bacteroidota bacterium]
MTLTAIVLLIALGLLLLALEVLILPGLIVGVIGGVLILIGVGASYISFGPATGNYVLLGTVISSVITGVLIFRSGTWKKASLSTTLTGKVNTIDEQKIKVGDIGITLSRISPMGKALVNGEEYEVTSVDVLINENTQVVVKKIDHNKVLVSPLS